VKKKKKLEEMMVLLFLRDTKAINFSVKISFELEFEFSVVNDGMRDGKMRTKTKRMGSHVKKPVR
jgi:hypothetical protein